MTVQTETNKIVYDGLIGQTVFAYNFRVDQAQDMNVYLSGLIIASDQWTIDGIGEDVGGNVTLNTPLAVDQTVTLLREVDETQLIDYQPFDAFPAEVNEQGLDKLTMMVQQVTELVNRNPVPPPDSQPGDEYNAYDLPYTAPGGVDRNAGDKFNESISVFDFMSAAEIADVRAGTLLLDTSAAAQTAIDSITTGVILVPPGHYLWEDNTVNIHKDGISLIGSLGDTRIINGQTNAPALAVGDGVTTIARVMVRGLIFAGKSGVTGVAGQCGMKVHDVVQSYFEDLYCFNFPEALTTGFIFETTATSFITGMQCQSCTGNGIEIIDCIDLYVTGVRSDANGLTGVDISYSEGMYFTSVVTWSNDLYGIAINYGASRQNMNMFFSNCIGDSSESHNWFIDDLQAGFFVNCWGVTQKTATVTTADGFHIIENASGSVSRLKFTNCIANNNNAHGWNVEDSTYVTWVNCIGEANGQASTASGINGETTTYMRIHTSLFASNSQYGVVIGNTCTNPSVVNNDFVSNVVGQLIWNTTPITIRHNNGFTSENQGAATITSGTTSVVVTHGMSLTPLASAITITPTANPTNDIGNIWVDSITATQFTVNCRNDPGASDFEFNWMAQQV